MPVRSVRNNEVVGLGCPSPPSSRAEHRSRRRKSGLWLSERSEFHRPRRRREAQGWTRDAGGFFCFVFLAVQENEKNHQPKSIFSLKPIASPVFNLTLPHSPSRLVRCPALGSLPSLRAEPFTQLPYPPNHFANQLSNNSNGINGNDLTVRGAS